MMYVPQMCVQFRFFMSMIVVRKSNKAMEVLLV